MVKNVIAIYPGRFQPMGRHHYDAFQWLEKKFGADKSYIATSDKVEPPKSPLSFNEKKAVANKYGITNQFVQVKNPYKAEEITSKYDPKTTAVVFMVGDKDMQEDARFKVGSKKDGSPSYFQKYDPNKPLEPYDKHGYLIVAPHVSYNIDGIGEMSGTNIRKALSDPKSTPKQFKDIFGWYDSDIETMLKKKFSNSVKESKPIYEILEDKAVLSSLLRSLLAEGGNAIPSSIEVDKEDVKTVVKKAISYLPKELRGSLQINIGSSGYKAKSGDIDIFIDEDAVIDYFQAKDEKTAKKALEKYLADKGLEAKTIGRNVHVGVPYKDAKAQVDFMVIKDSSTVAPWHQHGPRKSYEDPDFKGSDLFILINSIGKFLGLKFDPFGAKLLDRETGEVVARDRDKVAKILLNPKATEDDLNSVKAILKALENDPKKDDKLAQAKQDADKGLIKLSFDKLKEELLYEAASARIQHPEDLIYWEGSKGAQRALQIMDKAAKDPSTTSVKWDGSPAVIFGVDDHGNFILTDKSGFTAKGYDGKAKSAKELEDMFKNRAVKSAEKNGTKPDFTFAKSMGQAYEVFKKSWPKGLTGYFKGDLLYQSKPEVVDGEYVFKPNITTYKIPVNSELGKQITKSQVGVIPHVYQSLDGKETGVKNAQEYKFNPAGGLMVFSPVFPKQGAKVDPKLMSAASSAVSSAKSADKLLDKTKLSQEKMTDFADMLYKFTNSKANSMNSLSVKEFVKFLEQEKTLSDGKRAKMIEYSQQNQGDLDKIFNAVKAVNNLKNSIIAQLDSQDLGVKASIGDQSGGEGYVISDPSGPIKLVNRGGFTTANRAVQR